ncbi:MAG: TRAP transporter small permease [Deltaproteobacteria bacterium]|nr:MAG: TRAP transporter small permease [Deltaproteobacteria bacterium]
MKYIKGFDTALSKLEKLFLITSLTTMVVLAFVQVILRNFFSTGLLWVDELTRHLVLWVGFVAACIAAHEGRHINIDVLARKLSGRSKAFVEIIINFASFSICLFLLKASWRFVSVEMEFGERAGSLPLPVWVLEIIFPITFILISFRFGLRGLENLFKLVSESKS